MTKAKALKHLNFRRDSLNYWRERYVEICRDNNKMLDIPGLYLAGDYRTIREAQKAEAIAEMRDNKKKIAEFERIVK